MDCFEKKDRRIRKTKQAIKIALVDLLSRKKIINITVKELTDYADINRKTFYNHYQSIQEVVDEIIYDAAITYFFPLVEAVFHGRKETLLEVTRVFRSEKAFFNHLLQAKNNFEIKEQIYEILFCRMLSDAQAQAPNPTECENFTRCTLNYVISGVFVVYMDWLTEGCPVPDSALADFIYKTTREGICTT